MANFSCLTNNERASTIITQNKDQDSLRYRILNIIIAEEKLFNKHKMLLNKDKFRIHIRIKIYMLVQVVILKTCKMIKSKIKLLN